MPKYIDADAFVKEKREWYCEQCEKRKGMKRGRLQFVYEIGDAPCRACYIDDMISDIEDLPAAHVKPVRHGRWVGMEEYCQHLFDITGERYTMSQLGISQPHCNKCWEENERRKPFCPNCGAEMDAELPKEEKED